jgi:hypothetical protein
MFLHASKMRLPHPLDGGELRLEAALPSGPGGFSAGNVSEKERQDYGEKI